MSQQQKRLAALHEELRNLRVFDRIHDYTTNPDPANERAYAVRQARQKQIIDQITVIRASQREHWNRAWVSSAVVLVCTVGYAMLHYLLK